MKFTKMQGAGNDYVYVNCFEERLTDRPALAVRLSDRHFGVGADGLICVCPSERADVKMEMYNLDGSRGRMCGNGIRCVGKFAYEHGLTDKTELAVETDAGVKLLRLNVEKGRVRSVRVAMGRPRFTPAEVPVLSAEADFIDRPVSLGGREWRVTALSVGNPHAVVFVEDVDSMDVEGIGRLFERHPLFPQGVNTEFVKVLDRKTLQMRVWERGSGETLACGTGATASLAAAAVLGLTENAAAVRLRGGELFIEWDRESGELYMTGPAVTVFEGVLIDD